MKIERKLGRGGLLGNLKGQAGVYAVASQLCLRGHIPFFPAVDQGVDLVIGNGIRIQVKCAHLIQSKHGLKGGKGYYIGGAYGFNLRRGVWDKSTNRTSRREIRSYEGVADFFVLWGIDEDRFWIVPTSVKNRAIWFGAENYNGSNNSSYTEAMKKRRQAEYENRWDLLDVNAVVESVTLTVPSAGEYPIEIEPQEKH